MTVISKSGRKELQKCKATMLTERERHGMAELLGRMDPADLISLAQVAQFTLGVGNFTFTNLSDGDLSSSGGRYSCRSS